MSLLFTESPLIAAASLGSIGISIAVYNKYLIGFCIIVFILLLYFYRYWPVNSNYDNYTILFPASGKITEMRTSDGYLYLSIFLSPLDRHTQVYPANGIVIYRQYDHTGIFDVVVTADKSRYNEKKIHYMIMDNGGVMKLVQIAGMLPRMITSDEDFTHYKAGEYLGMIKFGSRVEMILPLSVSKNNETRHLYTDYSVGRYVNLGDIFAVYK